MGGNFKEKLREHGGLDAVIEIIRECHGVMEVIYLSCDNSRVFWTFVIQSNIFLNQFEVTFIFRCDVPSKLRYFHFL